MSFLNSLRRLNAAADYRQRGIAQDHCIVNRSDLRELLTDWARLDAEVRYLQQPKAPRFLGELTPTPHEQLHLPVVKRNCTIIDYVVPAMATHECHCERRTLDGLDAIPRSLTCVHCGGMTGVQD